MDLLQKNTRLRIIQIGTGAMVHAAHIASAVRALPENFDLLGLVEPDPERQTAIQNIPAYAGLPLLDFEEACLLQPDAFLVETDEMQLVPTAIRTLSAGFHTFMDKPGSQDGAEFHKMCRIAQENRKVLNIGYMYRTNPAVLKALEMVRAGSLGEMIGFEAQMSCRGDESYHRTLPRFKGGMMYYLGCHLIDLMLQFMGEPEEVIPLHSSTMLHQVACVDNAMCAYRYRHGVAMIRTSASEINGFGRRSLFISGTRGSLEIRPLEKKEQDNWYGTELRFTPDTANAYSDGSELLPTPSFKRYDRMMLDFAANVRAGRTPQYTPEYEAKLHDWILKSL